MRHGFLKTLADSRKMKYSTLSLAFCAVVIAVVILLNTIISVLASSFNWYIDMTDEQMFTLSDDAKDILDNINRDAKLEIVFPLSKDQIDTDYAVSSTSGSIGYIHKTALEIAQECDNVTISYHDTTKDYEFYKNAGLTSHAGPENILILRQTPNGRYAEGDFRSYPINYFFVQKGANDSSLYAYNGELVFLSALIAMSRDTTPTVYFTIGHDELNFIGEVGELTYDNIGSAYAAGKIEPEAYVLMTIFCDCGFTIKPLDIRLNEIPTDARMMVINQPTADFTEEELFKITNYLQAGGAVFCFTPFGAELPELYSTLSKNYGVQISPSVSPVIDDSHKMTNGGAVHYLANVSKDDDSFATAKYFSAYSNYSSANAYYSDAGSIIINPLYKTTEGYQEGTLRKYTYPLLESASTAKLGDSTGVHSLMTITSIDSWSTTNESSTFSYLVVCPSGNPVRDASGSMAVKKTGGFASSTALSLSTANRHMLLSLIQTTSSVQTPVNLDYKPFVEYELEITDSQARNVTIVIATILPVIIAVCGVVVIVRRKHR